jgi:DNA-binding NtrC family response regulator
MAGVIINVPPLAERLEDIPYLVRHFLDRAGAAHVAVTPAAMARLYAHHWPGHVRELKQTVEWAAALCEAELGEDAARAALAHRAAVAASCAPPSGIHDTFASERGVLRQTLERHGWNTDAAARELGVHRATLYRWMKRLRLSVPAPNLGIGPEASPMST